MPTCGHKPLPLPIAPFYLPIPLLNFKFLSQLFILSRLKLHRLLCIQPHVINLNARLEPVTRVKNLGDQGLNANIIHGTSRIAIPARRPEDVKEEMRAIEYMSRLEG